MRVCTPEERLTTSSVLQVRGGCIPSVFYSESQTKNQLLNYDLPATQGVLARALQAFANQKIYQAQEATMMNTDRNNRIRPRLRKGLTIGNSERGIVDLLILLEAHAFCRTY